MRSVEWKSTGSGDLEWERKSWLQVDNRHALINWTQSFANRPTVAFESRAGLQKLAPLSVSRTCDAICHQDDSSMRDRSADGWNRCTKRIFDGWIANNPGSRNFANDITGGGWQRFAIARRKLDCYWSKIADRIATFGWMCKANERSEKFAVKNKPIFTVFYFLPFQLEIIRSLVWLEH